MQRKSSGYTAEQPQCGHQVLSECPRRSGQHAKPEEPFAFGAVGPAGLLPRRPTYTRVLNPGSSGVAPPFILVPHPQLIRN